MKWSYIGEIPVSYGGLYCRLCGSQIEAIAIYSQGTGVKIKHLSIPLSTSDDVSEETLGYLALEHFSEKVELSSETYSGDNLEDYLQKYLARPVVDGHLE